jgi:hypothetical protein
MADGAIDSDLLDSLDVALERVKRVIDERLPLVRRDRIEADRLFVFAGEVDAVLRAASDHFRRVRAELEGIARDPS